MDLGCDTWMSPFWERRTVHPMNYLCEPSRLILYVAADMLANLWRRRFWFAAIVKSSILIPMNEVWSGWRGGKSIGRPRIGRSRVFWTANTGV